MTPPLLSRGLAALFSCLTRGAPPDGVLPCTAQAGNILGVKTLPLPVSSVRDLWIPPPLIPRLEMDPFPWRCRLAVHMHDRPATVSALAVGFPFARIFVNRDDPTSPYGQQPTWPPEIEATAERLLALSTPPTLLIDARSELVALWALADPLDVTQSDARVMALLRVLAARVGAVPPGDQATIADVTLPLPGFPIANATGGDPEVTTITHLSDRAYALADFEAACATEVSTS